MILYYILVPLAWLVWHIGFRIHVEGRENLKKVQTKGCILAPTHVSAIDPVFIVVTRWGRRMIVFAKKELFEINALLTWFFRCCGGVCVRGTKDEMAAIEQTVEKCRNGETLLIFPEGTREKEGKLLPPKSGLFVIAAGAGVDVVPCRILYDTPDGKDGGVKDGDPSCQNGGVLFWCQAGGGPDLWSAERRLQGGHPRPADP